jgi:hypothetical protein
MLDMSAFAATVAVSPIAASAHRPRQLFGYLGLTDQLRTRRQLSGDEVRRIVEVSPPNDQTGTNDH